MHWDIMFKQVEFLIQGYLLPMTIGRLQISSSFVLEDATAKKDSKGFFALAYVGVEARALHHLSMFFATFANAIGGRRPPFRVLA